MLDKSKILAYSQEKGGERYTKRFTCWIHLAVTLYAMIMRFDSLREITASLLAETRKLAHDRGPLLYLLRGVESLQGLGKTAESIRDKIEH